MSLISLLIALSCERMLQSRFWRFNYFYSHYIKLVRSFVSKGEISKNTVNTFLFALIPAIVVWFVLLIFDGLFIEFIVSTAILVMCIGCTAARVSYKAFLNAAMRGDEVAVSHHQMELQQGQDFEGESFGQTLVWLNYQYYVAIMLVFVIVGIEGALVYRILVALANDAKNDEGESYLPDTAVQHGRQLLFYIDYIPSRFAAFGYMLVGHFSRASTLWLEGLLNFNITPRKYLCEVAKESEEYKIEDGDLTAEPALLVRLAKRNVLLLLASIAFMTLAGVVS
ncbi:regulatory signaling modulator protein AmpE [Thalassotalea crassostreae]|uniref:regulatory signaling modulator protein AmpE n=1 Tax=Thalassotalea crassostreae TaxID=1763536 RepID=UPI000837DDD3|nr:regulatory signaling modulator protein AmpE [Thalassotalea crassostreae]